TDGVANITILPPCIVAAPSVNVSPSNPNAYSGDSVSYTLAITNNDSVACPPRTFNLSSAVPGWVTTFSQNPLVIPASTMGSATMSKLVPAGTTPGTYAVDALVTSSSWSSDTMVSVTVTAPCATALPTVTLSPANLNAYPGDRITYTVAVTNNDS